MNDAAAVQFDQQYQEDRIDTGAMAQESMPSLAEVAQEAGGAWPKGWYSAEVIAGYRAGNYLFETADTISKARDSRNLRIAMKLTAPQTLSDKEGNTVSQGATRNTFVSHNYRIEDLTAANVARVKSKAEDVPTRLRIALGKLGQIEVAVGMGFKRHPQGHINPTSLIGQKVDVRLGFDKKGFNEINAIAKAGSRVKA